MQQKEKNKNLYKFLVSFCVWGLNLGIWAYVWITGYYATFDTIPFYYKGNWLVVAVYAILLFLFTNFYGGYRIGYYRTGDMIFSGLWGLLFTNGITYLQTCLVGRRLMPSRPILIMTLIQGGIVVLWTVVANKGYGSIFPPRRMLLVYGENQFAKSLIHKMLTRSDKYLIQEVANANEDNFEQLAEKIEGYDAVVFCDVSPEMRKQLLKHCFAHSIRTYTTPNISDILIRGAEDINLFDTPLLLNRNSGLKPTEQFLKRMLDLLLSLFGLLAASPFLLLAAAAIKLWDGGPVLFKQTRLTLNGRRFEVYKLRSMVIEAEKECGATLSPKGDERITPVGKIMRGIRLDELPQLINILKGEMSFVGPRPERPELAEQYKKDMPEFDYRLKVKAGLTGYAQIVGRYNTAPYDKLKMDLMYIAGYSILEDIKLILMTFKIIFMKSSTEGVEKSSAEDESIQEISSVGKQEGEC